jgi:hypothetical protein
MAESILDKMFDPPILETGDRVIRKDVTGLIRKRGSVISSGGWYAVIKWDGAASSRREFIPDLEVDNS